MVSIIKASKQCVDMVSVERDVSLTSVETKRFEELLVRLHVTLTSKEIFDHAKMFVRMFVVKS